MSLVTFTNPAPTTIAQAVQNMKDLQTFVNSGRLDGANLAASANLRCTQFGAREISASKIAASTILSGRFERRTLATRCLATNTVADTDFDYTGVYALRSPAIRVTSLHGKKDFSYVAGRVGGTETITYATVGEADGVPKETLTTPLRAAIMLEMTAFPDANGHGSPGVLSVQISSVTTTVLTFLWAITDPAGLDSAWSFTAHYAIWAKATN